MKLSKGYTFITLLTLTLISSIVTMKTTNASFLLLTLWAAKFILVAFEFMELRKANIFWKISVGFVLVLILTIILLFL